MLSIAFSDLQFISGKNAVKQTASTQCMMDNLFDDVSAVIADKFGFSTEHCYQLI